jgi:hypothetical protein
LVAQGTLNFDNRGNGFTAPVTDARSGQRLDGVAWKAELYYAAGRVVDESMLIPARPATDFRMGPNAGYVVPLTIVLDDVSSGSLVTVQMRAWNTAAGTTFEQAAADASGVIGRSNLIYPTTGFGFPTDLIGLEAFSVFPAPEPDSEVLMFWGLIGVCFLKGIGSKRRGI